MSFLFGSSGSPAKPFRGTGYEQQGEYLNNLLLGYATGAFPEMASYYNKQQSGLQSGLNDLQSKKAQYESALQTGMDENNRAILQRELDNINNQISGLNSQLDTSSQLQTNPYAQYFQSQSIPTLNYQMPTFNAQQALADSFTPQYEIAQRAVNKQGQLAAEQLQSDLERRGLTTTGAAARSMQDLQSNLTDTLANTAAQLAAQQAQSQLGAYQYQNQSELAAQQAANQALMNQYNMGYQQQAYQDQMRQNALNNLMQLYSFSTGATPATQGSQGLLGSVAAPLTTYGLSMLSDKRFKENIKLIGFTKEGIPHVEFNYINDKTKYRGVLAQDAEKIVPSSVTEHNGIKYVNYNLLSIDCEVI